MISDNLPLALHQCKDYWENSTRCIAVYDCGWCNALGECVYRGTSSLCPEDLVESNIHSYVTIRNAIIVGATLAIFVIIQICCTWVYNMHHRHRRQIHGGIIVCAHRRYFVL
jgi:hypothetical protein